MNTANYNQVANAYCVQKIEVAEAMKVLVNIFGERAENVNEMNLIFFSTSGTHGTSFTIDQIEESLLKKEDGHVLTEDDPVELTFLVVHPRLASIKYGVCRPTLEETIYLRRLRSKTKFVASGIGL